MSQPSLSAFIWSVAGLLHGNFKAHDYGKVILPFIVLSRLDCVLAPTKAAVLKELDAKTAQGVNPEPFLRRKAGLTFFNQSPLDLHKLLGDPDHIAQNLFTYVQGFSEDVRDIFARFEFQTQVEQLAKAGLLYQVTEKFTQIDLHPDRVSNMQMGMVFEELIRKFAEISNETAGEHFTPREVIRLMVNLIFIEDDAILSKPGVVRTIYDPTAGTGGMLSVAGEYLAEHNPQARLTVFGQELNPESYAICKADMLIKGQDVGNIAYGNTLSDDGHTHKKFDYMLSNPPFGVEWKKVEKEVRKEHEQQGYNGRFGPGLPRVSDGSMLFLLHLIDKMRPAAEGGSRFGIVLNGSPLFTGGAGSGESEIRRYVLENDLLEAIVGLPNDMFYNTGIATYVWIISNRKPAHRQGKVQLIDASGMWQKMRKSLGSKRKELSDAHIDRITQIFGSFTEAEHDGKPISRIFDNEDFGYRTAYLWEQVWQRDSWLEILARYLVTQRDDKKRIKAILFPRYHQLDATRRLVQAVLAEGAGQKYLIQHSAGSGKTNSIAWSAHFLADLHDANNAKVFDTVLVVSDRTVLDTQLQEAIFDFERTAGVVATIKGAAGSKSAELAEALSGSKKIVVCTIQTFPFALKAVQELAATQGKRFAVIADEAHSSQTGEAASKLKQLLNAEELKDLADGGEVSTEDLLAAQMTARASAGQDAGITYVAFTATPKAKTLELFGRRPNAHAPAGPDNLPAPFHVYSMRQAIEEGFILDVLKNYTPYKLAFKLANKGQEWDEKEVERNEAMKGLMRWVRLHPYNISQKVAVVVEHFAQNVQPLLNGHAKAMVVVGSRLEAVRWKLAIDNYIIDNGYKLGTLVAFSGEVNDPENLPEPVTETSAKLNPNLKSRDMREAFATDEYQILLVANKFQTGFDQPLLCGMYVDKRLSGIQAVQTLSRLNRAYSGPHGHKDTTYILDFVNDPEEVLTAFRQYFETAELAGVTDPDLVFSLKSKLDASGHYDDFEVERVAQVVMNPKATQSMLTAAIEPVADRLLKRYKAAKALIADNGEDKRKGKATQAAKDEVNALLLFKADLGSFIRVYAFLSQMFDYGNTGIEKRALFFKHLLPLLDFGRDREGVDLSKVVLTHHRLKDEGYRDLALGQYASENSENDKLQPMTAPGTGEVQEKQKALLSAIVEKVNDLFEGELSDNDKLVYVNNVIKGKLMESDLLQQQAANNSKSQFANSPDLDNELMNAIMDALSAHTTMSKQALD